MELFDGLLVMRQLDQASGQENLKAWFIPQFLVAIALGVFILGSSIQLLNLAILLRSGR